MDQDTFKRDIYYAPGTGLMADWSGMDIDDGYIASKGEMISSALKAMDELEAGAIANPDENRMVCLLYTSRCV